MHCDGQSQLRGDITFSSKIALTLSASKKSVSSINQGPNCA